MPFWFDINLKDYEVKTDYSICYEGIELTTDNIYYEAEYTGKGKIKYGKMKWGKLLI